MRSDALARGAPVRDEADDGGGDVGDVGGDVAPGLDGGVAGAGADVGGEFEVGEAVGAAVELGDGGGEGALFDGARSQAPRASMRVRVTASALVDHSSARCITSLPFDYA